MSCMRPGNVDFTIGFSLRFRSKEILRLNSKLACWLFDAYAGSVVIALFADPLVDSVSGFAKATNLNAFIVSFVITPFASNASELVSSLQFACASAERKKINGFFVLVSI